jgi:formamidopyrimidine-DNA glycosylase
MPELPEVETIRRQLEPEVVGRRLERIAILDPRWSDPAPPDEVAQALEGRRIESLGRRGKWLIAELADDIHLVMHLRMTGNLLLVPPGDTERRFLRVRMDLDDGRHLLFADARRFGTGIVLLGSDALHDYFAGRVGIEPLGPDFTPEALRGIAAGRRAPVKAFLLSQERVAGVGNIYADEALWRAKINPLRPVGTLKPAQLEALRDAVVEVLHAGIDSKGATIDDYRDASGVEGSFQHRFQVHMREGKPCPRCGTRIKKIRAAGRGTYYCPRCQPMPRARAGPRASRPGPPREARESRRPPSPR